MIICKECHPTHDESHMRKLLRFRTMQWLPNVPGVPDAASCWHCAQDSPKSRWQCDKCQTSLCRRCAGHVERRDAFLKAHAQQNPDHRSFWALYPQHWTTTTRWITDRCPCQDTGPFAGHCERCHGGEWDDTILWVLETYLLTNITFQSSWLAHERTVVGPARLSLVPRRRYAPIAMPKRTRSTFQRTNG